MVECYRCGDPIDGHAVELVRHPDGKRVEIHGTCLLKSYSAKAHQEDQPKAWGDPNKAHHGWSLEEHVDALIEDGAETYRRGRELMEAQP